MKILAGCQFDLTALETKLAELKPPDSVLEGMVGGKNFEFIATVHKGTRGEYVLTLSYGPRFRAVSIDRPELLIELVADCCNLFLSAAEFREHFRREHPLVSDDQVRNLAIEGNTCLGLLERHPRFLELHGTTALSLAEDLLQAGRARKDVQVLVLASELFEAANAISRSEEALRILLDEVFDENTADARIGMRYQALTRERILGKEAYAWIFWSGKATVEGREDQINGSRMLVGNYFSSSIRTLGGRLGDMDQHAAVLYGFANGGNLSGEIQDAVWACKRGITELCGAQSFQRWADVKSPEDMKQRLGELELSIQRTCPYFESRNFWNLMDCPLEDTERIITLGRDFSREQSGACLPQSLMASRLSIRAKAEACELFLPEPGDCPLAESALAAIRLAKMRGQSQESIRKLALLGLEKEPHDAVALQYLSESYSLTGEPAKGLEKAQIATRFAPHVSAGWLARGLAHAKLGQYETAIRVFGYLAQKGLYTTKQIHLSAYCYAQLGQTDKAIALLERVDEHLNTPGVKGLILELSGQKKESRNYFKEYEANKRHPKFLECVLDEEICSAKKRAGKGFFGLF